MSELIPMFNNFAINSKLLTHNDFITLKTVVNNFQCCSDEAIDGTKKILFGLLSNDDVPTNLRLSMDIPCYRDGCSYIGLRYTSISTNPVFVFRIDFSTNQIYISGVCKGFTRIPNPY